MNTQVFVRLSHRAPRAFQAAKPGETLVFGADDNRELIAWANDLTTVWKALAPHAR